MKKINPAHIEALLELINNGPFLRLLSMNVCELGVGSAKIEVDLQRKHYNPFGVIHGGVYSSVIDTAAYWSAYCEMDENVGYTSIDLTVNILSMINEGKIFIDAKSIKIGRSICLTEAYVKDLNGKLLAHGTAKMMILREKQSIAQAIKAMGYPPLPPKFVE
jgi:uncharacterized protein (TIGR00369 family)